MKLIIFLLISSSIIIPAFAQEEPNCGPDTFVYDGNCVRNDGPCKLDMNGDLFCTSQIEDRLTLERFLFDPPYINDKPTVPMGLVLLIISIIIIGVFLIRRKRKSSKS